MKATDSMKRIGFDLLVLIGLYVIGINLMAHFRIMETALALGSQPAVIQVLLALGFLVIRLLLIFVVPGWVVARLVLLAVAKARSSADTIT